MDNQEEIQKLKELIAQEGNYEIGEYKGVTYELKRIEHMGHWCGYVHWPVIYDESLIELPFDNDWMVHGGITYKERITTGWILGFDCAHTMMDLIPKLFFDGCIFSDSPFKVTYKTKEYVINECKKLIRNLEMVHLEEKGKENEN